jgi:5'/3'-nucleotidase SurE
MRYGLQKAQEVLGGPAELALSGINAGRNGGIVALISGTVGAATEAAKQGIPAIAFSGGGEQVGYNTPTLPYQQIYSDLSLKITETLIASGKPYLPKDIWLNVNYPDVTDTACTSTSDFKFVLSRVYPWFGGDVETCGSTDLPDETSVFNTDGCYVSISASNAYTKLDVNAATQKVVLDKLGSILSCLP